MKQLEFDFTGGEKMLVGKSFTFDAAHSLQGHFKCGAIHGHTYTMTIEVEGKINTATGMVMDLHLLKEIAEEVIKIFDHRYINTIPELPDEVCNEPTCENIAQWIVSYITPRLLPLGVSLKSIKIQEGQGGYALWKES